MLETELGRGIRNRIALGFGSLSQGAHRAEFTVVRKQRTALRASSFALRICHCILLGTRSLLDLLPKAREKSLVMKERLAKTGPKRTVSEKVQKFDQTVADKKTSRSGQCLGEIKLRKPPKELY